MSYYSGPSPPPPPPPPSSSSSRSVKSWWIVIAAVIVAVIANIAVALALTSGGGKGVQANPNDNDPVASAETRKKKATSPGEGESVCGLAPGDQAVPATPPAAKWELVGTMAIPTDPKIGPGVTSDEGIHSCYAHSPTGALFAAVAVMADGATVADQGAVLEARAMPSADRDRAIAAAQDEAAHAEDMPEGYGGEIRVQVAGYQVTAVTPDTFSGMIVLSSSGYSAYSAVPVTMQWYEGDWRSVYSENVTPVALTSLAGYTPWAGA